MTTAAAAVSSAQAPAGATPQSSALAKLSENSQTFLRLLTTQLQNQDPMQPQDPTEFTNQLVQFTQVEQQIQSNQKLDSLLQRMTAFEMSAALSYVGRTVEAEGDRTELADGRATVVYGLSAEAGMARIVVAGADGRPVRVIDAPKSAGRNEVEWDGRDSSGAQLPDGVYRFSVLAQDRQGRDLQVETRTVGRVRSVESAGSAGTVLMVGGHPVPLGGVLSVRAGQG